MVYATVDDYRERFGLETDGSEDPEGLERGLLEASNLFDDIIQIQAAYVISEFGIAASAYSKAVCEQVRYWVEIAGPNNDEVDLSQHILRPAAKFATIGSVTIDKYQVIAPRALDVLRTAGLYFPDPSRITYRWGYGRR